MFMAFALLRLFFLEHNDHVLRVVNIDAYVDVQILKRRFIPLSLEAELWFFVLVT